MDSNFSPLWRLVTWIQICASLYHRNTNKAEHSWPIPRKLTANLELLMRTWKTTSLDETKLCAEYTLWDHECSAKSYEVFLFENCEFAATNNFAGWYLPITSSCRVKQVPLLYCFSQSKEKETVMKRSVKYYYVSSERLHAILSRWWFGKM